MTREEAAIKCLDLFDLLRPQDVTDSEWLTAKVTFGLINKANQTADSYIKSIREGYTHEQLEEAIKLEFAEYIPQIKQWIIDQMR